MYNVILQTPEGKTLPDVWTPLSFSEHVNQVLRRFTRLCFPYLKKERVEKATGEPMTAWTEEICLPYVIEHIEDYLMNNLHGSGWDSDWEVVATKTKRGFIATMAYHCMNENGYYDGWISINVYLDDCLNVLRVTFPRTSSYHRRTYLWDGYYEECIYEVFRELQHQIIEDSLIEREGIIKQ